jgi:hypothetical protein
VVDLTEQKLLAFLASHDPQAALRTAGYSADDAARLAVAALRTAGYSADAAARLTVAALITAGYSADDAARVTVAALRTAGYSADDAARLTVAALIFCHTATGGTQKAMGRKVSDVGHGIGMCHVLGVEQETIGWSAFEAKYEIDAQEIARELAADFERRFPNK